MSRAAAGELDGFLCSAPPAPPQLRSSRLYVVLMKVLPASEEHTCRRRSLRGRGEWVRGFVTPPLFLFIPFPLRLLFSSGHRIRRLPPIILCSFMPPLLRLFTSIVKPESWGLAWCRCQQRGSLGCAKTPSQNRPEEEGRFGGSELVAGTSQGWIVWRKLCFLSPSRPSCLL